VTRRITIQNATATGGRHHSAVGPETFEFDADVVTAADANQRELLDALRQTIRQLAPVELDLSATRAEIGDGTLRVTLPHRSRDDQFLAVSVSSHEAIVNFGIEHEHFWPDDPANGRLWPIAAPDHATAAVELVKAILGGRVELEVHDGVLMQRVTSYFLDDDGTRTEFASSGTFRLRRERARARIVRFDFGVTRR
jgi:hypothetical protein